MLIYFSSLILATSLSVFLGLFVFFKNIKGKINILFLLKSLLIAVFIFAAVMIQYSVEVPSVLFWYKIMLAAMVLIPCVFIYFYSHFIPKEIQSKRIHIIVYVYAAIVLWGLLYFDNPLESRYDLVNGFWVVSERFININMFVFLFYLVFSSSMFFRMLYRWSKTTAVIKEKYHATILFIGTASVLFSSLLFDTIINTFYKLPHIAPTCFFIYLISVFYALNKYHFLHHDLKDHFDEIFHHITDFIIMLDAKGIIIKANQAILDRLNKKEKDLLGKDLSVFLNMAGFSNVYNSLLKGKLPSASVTLSYKSENGKIMADSYISRMSDKFGDFLGIMIISKEKRSIRQLQEKYGISQRQLDILMLTVEGDSNVRISEKLNISRRTVETHLYAIYSKLGIKNKVELIKILNEFGAA